MRILALGAGVIGSLYATRLKEAEGDVTLLARGRRPKALKEHGSSKTRSGVGRPSGPGRQLKPERGLHR